MSYKLNRIVVLSFALLFLLMVIPSCLAIDNETAIMVESANDTVTALESQNSDDVLAKDYYFDSNIENDTGDGSIDNPYKELSDSRIKDYSVIHLANGNYSFSQRADSYRDITVYGQDASRTIIECDYALVVSGNFNLRNVTLINTPIISKGVLNASNTIFKDSTALNSDSYGNTYGGAISSSSNRYSVILNNCTFINNTAQYGGAVSMKGGSLEISDCLFINNTAYNYGGAITAFAYDTSKPKVKIRNSVFVNSSSLNDAGGAIYLRSVSFTADEVTIESSKATFGSAITLLNSYSRLSNLHLNGNVAKYDGGAVYLMYGNLTLENSSFTNNRANKGGAFFIDGSYYFFISNNTFRNNTADFCAGAFYSVSNDYGINENNTYENNSAMMFDDIYETLELDAIIASGNYSMYRYNMTYDGTLPKYYSSYDLGYVSPAKHQQDGGNCWAFAVLSTLEACISKITGSPVDLSEENMKNLMGRYSDYGWNMPTNEGGYDDMAIGYLVSWMGPVLESDDAYDDCSDLSPLLESIMHIQNVVFISRNSFTDNAEIKKAIMNYGAVYSAIYIDEKYSSKLKAYYQYVDYVDECDHAVAIIGWDDSIAIPGAPGNGAWIAKNSWGSDWANDGFYYVSYYDTSCARIGSDFSAFTFVLNDTIRYDKNYQYDLPGKTDYFLNSSSTVWYKNIYTSTDDEYLAAVSTYFEKNTNWVLSVYVNGDLKLTKSGYSTPGYRTIEFDEFIPLNVNDSFEIVFKINVKGRAGVPISEYISLNKYFYREGISFLSYDGLKWKDLYELEWTYPDHIYSSQVACIKAFTVLDLINTTLDLNVSYNGFNPVEITANVYNNQGLPMNVGRVMFNLSDELYTVNVVNGVAKISHIFKRGLNTVSATFYAGGYASSANSTQINVEKIDVDFELAISSDYDASTVNISISSPINEAVTILLNDAVYTVNSKSGFASYTFRDLDYGFYNVSAFIDTALYDSGMKTGNFTISVKKTNICANSLATVYKSGKEFVIQLFDSFGKTIEGKNITVSLNGIDYVRTTGSSGEVSIPVSLAVGTYAADITFRGDADYSKSYKSSIITVKSSISISSTAFTYNSKCKITFLDKNSLPLANRQVSVVFNGATQRLTTNSNGIAYITITKKPGTYVLKITNPETGEVKSISIKVVARITQNKNINMYYGAGTYYKVKVLDDNGKAAAGVKVRFTLNGKYYYKTTDKYGFASIKITLNPKTYNIVAYYKGYKVTNKIIVKPTIVTKNVLSKKSTVKFNAKLLSTKGAILKNKIVTFKLGKKTYKVKTNAYGTASLILKDLKVGKYAIISSYGAAKVTNYIRIAK